MNKRKIRLENQYVGLAFDSVTGELVELVNNITGENLLKNWFRNRSMPFALMLRKGSEEPFCVGAPASREAAVNNKLKPHISLASSEEGISNIRMRYEYLHSPVGDLHIAVEIGVRIVPGDPETVWTIRLEHQEPDIVVEEVRFPCLFGVYWGETWQDDTLVYPFNAGEKITNAVETYAAPPSIIHWKWQDYKYNYYLNGVNSKREKDGSFVREHRYSGPLSMMWLDYYSDSHGLYLASYDEQFHVAGLHCETFGPAEPGMGFYAIRYPFLENEETWNSGRYAVAIHPGDWHWGADRYRGWRKGVGSEREIAVPEWFAKSAGLVAHYDFKYQDGTIVHKFRDLPRLYEQAKQMGLNHLLLSGWHVDGFDHGFPIYRPDPELGTAEELAEHVQAIRRNGGHVAFYINSKLLNMKYEELASLRDDYAVHNRTGLMKIERYGDDNLSFAVLCNGSEGWRHYLFETVRFLVDKIGADSMYFDQLGMSPPPFCFRADHSHRHDGWNIGYGQFLDQVNERFAIGSMYEGVTDIHGNKICGQLISTFFYHHSGAFPELYRYTFPDQRLIDMIYPSKKQAMRPVHVSQVSRDMIDRAFLIGCYLWMYDLENDNTFQSDPDMLNYVMKVVRLRKQWLELYGQGTFLDDTEIVHSTSGVTAKTFRFENRKTIITVCSRNPESAWTIDFKPKGRTVKSAVLYELATDSNEGEPASNCKILSVTPLTHEGEPIMQITAASARLAFIHILYDEM